MPLINIYQVGDRVRIETGDGATRTPFQDVSGTAFDPEVVKFEVKAPDLATVTYTYPTAAITKLATGDYACDIDVNVDGNWYYHIIGEQNDGENRGGYQGYFKVEKKKT